MSYRHGCPAWGARPRTPSRTRWHAALRTAPALLILGIGPTALGQAEASVREYRTLDGSGNNRQHLSWGMAGATYRREASGAHYANGVSSPTGAARPGARLISNLLAAQGDTEIENGRGLSTCVYEFGQFLDHDIGLASGGTTESFNIPVPTGDPSFDPQHTGTQVIGMKRSAFDPATGTTTPRQQINTVTAYIDASHIYGSDSARATWLRTGQGGRLRTISEGYGPMLPYNDGTMSNDDPLHHTPTDLFVAGDVRANEQPGLTTLHAVFVREHNWQAARLRLLHPFWTDEQLYQEARRWVAAEMQVITYKEFLPALIGRELPAYTGYRSWVNAGLSNAFATAAYRIGHSMVGPDIDLMDEHFEEFGVLELADSFFNPSAIPDAGGLEPIVRYFASSRQQETDPMIVDPLRNFLFGPPGAGGFDLAALNIQRGRDHGLADYNTVRQDFGLSRVTTFSQITSNTSVAQRLQQLYGSVNSIDPWVGMLAEDHVPGASLGPTHLAVFTDQFERLRDGDRFWYQNGQFTNLELFILERTRLSDIFRRTTAVAGLQANVFFAVEHGGCAADFNRDGIVNANDLAAFIGAWSRSLAQGTLEGDFDGDGVVQTSDVVAYVHAWYDAVTNGC